ncbi:MAG: transglycosylase SLT domain-containing protein, partial [Bacteroidales bacterium]|nr:transglycosylase SLT domain-containing protein [Bacteroidales bacterium]
MKILTTITTIASLLVMSFTADAQIFNNQNKSRTKQLEIEKSRMADKIDSLELLLNKYEKKLAEYDSVQVFSQETEGLTPAGIAPEDYTEETIDSLLTIWYRQHQLNQFKGENYDMETVKFTSAVSDKTIMERLKQMNSYITLPYNETVRNYIILYAEKMPTKMGIILGLANFYFPMLEEVLGKYDMPLELKYMAIIESALNPKAVSRVGARGMWQFMHYTARDYGLRINTFVDERYDPYKAADAAARYMKDSYAVFGDWNLAISSYNCGLGNVKKAIRRAGGRTDFWSIYPYLPRETRGYVPAFVGASYAMTYYKEHGLVPVPVSKPAAIDTFEIKRNLHFKQVSELVGVSVETLRDLNPQYLHDIVPGNEGQYILRIPYSYTSRFIDVEDSLYTYKASQYLSDAVLQNIRSGYAYSGETTRVAYRVKSGDTLGRIASRNRTTVSNLKKWNHLKSDRLRIGQIIYIYKPGVKKMVEPKQEEVQQTTATQATTQTQTTQTTPMTSKPDSVSLDSMVTVVSVNPGKDTVKVDTVRIDSLRA